MVTVFAFYSDDPSSNPAEVYRFYSVNCLKRTQINKKMPGIAHFFKKYETNFPRLERTRIDYLMLRLLPGESRHGLYNPNGKRDLYERGHVAQCSRCQAVSLTIFIFTAIFLSSLSLAFIRPFTTECAIEETDDNFLFGLTPNVANDDDDDYEDLVNLASLADYSIRNLRPKLTVIFHIDLQSISRKI